MGMHYFYLKFKKFFSILKKIKNIAIGFQVELKLRCFSVPRPYPPRGLYCSLQSQDQG